LAFSSCSVALSFKPLYTNEVRQNKPKNYALFKNDSGFEKCLFVKAT